MGFVILDPEIVKQLEGSDSTEVRDTAGRIVGVFYPKRNSISADERAELERRRQNRSGKPMGEVLKRLARQ